LIFSKFDIYLNKCYYYYRYYRKYYVVSSPYGEPISYPGYNQGPAEAGVFDILSNQGLAQADMNLNGDNMLLSVQERRDLAAKRLSMETAKALEEQIRTHQERLKAEKDKQKLDEFLEEEKIKKQQYEMVFIKFFYHQYRFDIFYIPLTLYKGQTI